MWFPSLFARSRSAPSPDRPRRRPPGLALEVLEDRTVPSSLGVSSGRSSPEEFRADSALVGSLAGTHTQPFRVDGTFAVVAAYGNEVEVELSGTASPGGAFTGEFEAKLTGNRISGTPTLAFANGSTLTFYYEGRIDRATRVVQGTYWIQGGTGMFAGAGGTGTIWYPFGPAESFTMNGTLTR